MSRLSLALSDALPEALGVRALSVKDAEVGIVHLGIGAFHRAHQAAFTQQAMQESGGNWFICGVSLRSPGVRDAMSPQDGLYTLAEKSSQGVRYQLMSAVKEVLVAPENPQAVIDAIADPRVKIVSMTITEKGYCYDFGNNQLDLNNTDIAADLSGKALPKTMPGFIVAAMQKRRLLGLPGVSILSCDNLSHNGRVASEVILSFAQRFDPELRLWIEEHLSFPSTMVDRIVPATTQQDLDAVHDALGVEDFATVVCEPYKQWVIEDRFISGRPDWEAAGALLVSDVAPYETLKLRLLNGSHSALAYLGLLLGYDYVYEAMDDKQLRCFIECLIDHETGPSLNIPDNIDLNQYKAQVIERFSNRRIEYRVSQVGSDGSQKLPQRLLMVVEENLSAGRPVSGIALVVAAWFLCLSNTTDGLSDPLTETMQTIWKNWLGMKQSYSRLVEILFAELGVFPVSLVKDQTFQSEVAACLEDIADQGMRGVLQRFT